MRLRHVALLVLGTAWRTIASAAATVQVAPVDHGPWDALLARYVDAAGLVNYAGWHASDRDRQRLREYLTSLGQAPESGDAVDGAAEIATLINAYNAFTIEWILDHFPTPSIRALDDSWSAARWRLGGRKVSLDEIEHQNLRPLFGWRVHAVVVCAARSCPPLRSQAFTADNLEALTDDAYRDWLAREDLNQFFPEADAVRLSPIFKWYADDFQAAVGGLPAVLERYAPVEQTAWLTDGKLDIRYMDYHWGLNAQSALGADYQHGLLQRIF